MMKRPALIVAVVALSLTVSSCALLPSSSSSSTPARSQATSSSSPSASSTPSASDTGSSSATPGGNSEQASWPFAGFDPAAHATFPDTPTSPDRQLALTSDAKPPGFASPPSGSGIQRYVNQKLSWTDCDGGECARVLVPLDWNDPDGQAITLDVFRKKAKGDHVGSLFVNPGGPGGSGVSMARGFDGSPYPGLDVVGWDPRGSGNSTPVVCGSNAQMDALNALDGSPDNQAEWDALIKGNKDFAAACRENSGPLLDHISTIDNVRDLDYLRFLVGDEKLTYLGISYGTFVGSVYAELFPQRAGRLVLDSAVNITDKDSVIQQMGFDLALREFASWCATRRPGGCALGTTEDSVIKRLTDFFTQLDASPAESQGRVFNDTAAVLGVAGFLYSGEQAYASLYGSLMWAVERQQYNYLQMGGDWLIGRDSDGNYGSLAFSFPAIACADSPDGGLAEAKTGWTEDEKKAPIFGTWMGPNLQCTYWTAKPMPNLNITAKGAAPILVLGATGDPATPYQQAEWMADQLQSGVLLTWKGAGHSAYELGNSCVKDKVHAFINQGTVPADRTTC